MVPLKVLVIRVKPLLPAPPRSPSWIVGNALPWETSYLQKSAAELGLAVLLNPNDTLLSVSEMTVSVT